MLGHTLRRVCSYAPRVGLSPKRNLLGRKPGISALVRVRNEPWIVPSLLSLKNLADEIIVIDASTDETTEDIRSLMRNGELEIRYQYFKSDLMQMSQRALELSSCEWILEWDGDFVGYTSGTRDVRGLRKLVLSLACSRYFFTIFKVINLDYDLFPIRRDVSYYVEKPYLFTYHPSLIYRLHSKLFWETLNFPLFFKGIDTNSTFAMHLRSVKPPRKYLERRYETAWTFMHAQGKYTGTLDDYVRERISADLGTLDIEEASKNFRAGLFQLVIPYNKERLGDYPDLLKEYAERKMAIKL